MVAGQILQSPGLLRGAIGLLRSEPERPVGAGHADGVGNVAEVLADGPPVDFAGVVAEMRGESAATRSVVAGSCCQEMAPSRRSASVNPFSESPGIPYTRRTPDAFRIDTITSATLEAICAPFPAERRYRVRLTTGPGHPGFGKVSKGVTNGNE